MDDHAASGGAGMRSRRKRFFRVLCCIAISCLAVATGCNAWLLVSSRERIFRAGSHIEPRGVGLVLGTSPTVGRLKNAFFEGRMDSAAQLWRDGKVRHLLVSGDNSRREYDEPTAMRDALVARGVPVSAITLDYAGFRTLDSLVRARKVFGVRELVVVTDDWHQPRALFLARAAGLDAVGISSEDVPWRISVRTRVREWASRVKAVADVYVLGTRPKFLGEPVILPL
jgi:SanA protein